MFKTFFSLGWLTSSAPCFIKFWFIFREGPALVVACGRDTISYASSIRCLAPDNVFVIQVEYNDQYACLIHVTQLEILEIFFLLLNPFCGMYRSKWYVFIPFQIQHPRFHLDRFDLVVTPRHDYYALTAKGQQEVPRLLRRGITPQEPPGPNVVCCSCLSYVKCPVCFHHVTAVLFLTCETCKARSSLLVHYTKQILLLYVLPLQIGMLYSLLCRSHW